MAQLSNKLSQYLSSRALDREAEGLAEKADFSLFQARD